MLKLILGTIVLLSLFSAAANGQVSSPQAVSGEYIVKYKNRGGVSAGLKIFTKNQSGVAVKAVFAGAQMMHVKVNSESARDSLYSNPDVEFVEPNYILSVNPVDLSALGSAPLPSDSYSQSSANTQVRDSWNIQKPYDQGTKTIVAVIDTGLATSHLLFQDSGSIWENSAEKSGIPGVDDDGNGYIDDVNGWNFVNNTPNITDDNNHGTHVAGIVLGVGQDVFATPVRESKIRLMTLKFLDGTGNGTTASAVNAIYYAVSKGAKVINNSWGGPSYSQSLHEAYAHAYNNGVVIVSAAGNSNTNNDVTPMYPANIDSPNNISVISTTSSDVKSSFSNFGAATTHVAAPGSSILSSVPGTGCLAPGCFQMMSGTSMASPFVAGLAALVVREAPQLSAYQVRSIILASVDTFVSLSGKVAGSGRVNAFKAITNAKAQVSTVPWSPAYTPEYKTSRSTASEEAAPKAGCGLVSALADSMKNGGGAPPTVVTADAVILIAILLMPLLLALILRRQQAVIVNASNRRVYQRFAVAGSAMLKCADQQWIVEIQDISLGGISLRSDFPLADGQIVEMKLSERSSGVITAQVLRSIEAKQYALRFTDISESEREEIRHLSLASRLT